MKPLSLIVALTLFYSSSFSQANYDESKVPDYTLPDLLTSTAGQKITSAQQWQSVRRPEVLKLMEEYVYGSVPELDYKVKFSTKNLKLKTLPETIEAKEVTIQFYNQKGKVEMNMLVFLPAKSKSPVPLFLAYNFYGNQSIHPDPAIAISESYVNNSSKFGIDNNRVDESSRGIRVGRWPVENIIARGYGLATIHYGDVDPDFHDGFANGIHALADRSAAQSWPTISAWAWGLSRALDYLETDKQVDATRVAVLGHSRLGKTALWAGATDQRFALTISNNSGCGGAALSKRQYGETLAIINHAFPHWFNQKFKTYDHKEESLPVDQHMLLALIAPRPVYVGSAVDDRWADPKGEYLSLYHAAPVYNLFGSQAELPQTQPPLEKPLHKDKMAYHVREGKHDLTTYDWEQYMNFADLHLKTK